MGTAAREWPGAVHPRGRVQDMNQEDIEQLRDTELKQATDIMEAERNPVKLDGDRKLKAI